MIDAHQNKSNYIDSIQKIQMIYLSPHSQVRGRCSHVWLRRYVLMNNSINFWLCKIVAIIYHLFNITVLLMSRPGYPTHYGLFFIPLWSPVCFYRMLSEKKKKYTIFKSTHFNRGYPHNLFGLKLEIVNTMKFR